jgi:hypothetical protein
MIVFRVHGDVFRPPHRKHVLSALVGSGVQLFMMSFIVIGWFLIKINFLILINLIF